MKNNYNRISNIITDTSGEVPEIIIYGYIGQEEWWSGSKEDAITDVEFRKTVKDLESKHARINIRFNSPGGSMYHGNPMATVIQNSKAEIHGYNDGLAASMCSGLWLACTHRHMAENAMLMVHSPNSIVMGNAQDMREEADLLDKWEYTLLSIAAKAFNMTPSQTKEKYFDYKDHWMNYEEAKALGLITADEKYQAEDVVEDVQNKSMKDIIAHYKTSTEKDNRLLIQKLADGIAAKLTAPKKNHHFPNNSKSNTDMNKSEFQTSIEDKTLSIEDITAVLDGAGYTVATKTTEPPVAVTPPVTDAAPVEKTQVELIAAAVAAAIAPLNAKIEALGAAPGGYFTQLPSASDDFPDTSEPDVLDTFNATLTKLAGNGANVPFQ